jgi:hypothetical protein
MRAHFHANVNITEEKEGECVIHEFVEQTYENTRKFTNFSADSILQCYLYFLSKTHQE